MNYNLLKFEEKLNSINDLISNLTDRTDNITYLNLLGEYCQTINNYKINEDYEVVIDVTRKYIITFNNYTKSIIAVGVTEDSESKFVSYFIYNYSTTKCSSCKKNVLNIIDFLYCYFYQFCFIIGGTNNYVGFTFMYPMLDTDTFLDNLIQDLNSCLK